MKTARNSRGVSLLIVLAFIVIISVLVVGFAESMRLLRPTAASHLERARADQFAWSGVERVIAVLNQQTADTNRNWATQPGQLITGSLADDGSTAVDERKVLSQVVPLHSGTATTSADPVLAPPNLNVVTYRDPTSYLLTDKTEAGGTNAITMPVAWLYVRQSGAMDTNAAPSISTNDPIVGRYAYWTDDESSKINYNIAWGRAGNTNAPGHPTRIELSALSGFSQSYADTLRNFVAGVPANTPFQFFNTPLDARRIEMVSGGAGVAAALKANKFDVTHFNSDPNTTFFNEPRIVLTTRPDRAGWTYQGGQWVGVNGLPWPDGRPFYLRVLANEGTTVQPNVIPVLNSTLDSGRNIRLSAERVSETINMLALAAPPQPSYLQRSDWPMVAGGASIQDKYFGSYPAQVRSSRLAELSINIIDYVRAKESPQDVIEPIRGQFMPNETDPKMKFTFSDNSFNSYTGISRTPHVTEIGVWTGTATVPAPMPSEPFALPQAQPGQIIYKFKWEFHLPKNYGIPEVDLSKLYVLFGATGALYSPPTQGYSAFRLDAPGAWDNPSNPGSGVLRAGDYAVYTHVQPVASGTAAATTMPSPRPTVLASFRMSVSLVRGNTNLDIVPVAAGSPVQINIIPIDPDGVGEGSVTTIETDDPRVNKQRGDWRARSSGNTLGSVNGRWSVGKSPGSVQPPLATGAPEFDTDSAGNISDASFSMPPPAGKIFTRADGTIDDNTRGQVMSAGELGSIHTGIEGCLIVRMNAVDYNVPPGVPWRTLRLQPNRSTTSVVPDWALIDLFTAPLAAPNQYNKYVYAPHDTGFGGRVNLNSKAQPFGLERITPLAAVLQNNTYDSTDLTKKLGASTAQTIASNIFNRTLATTTPVGKQYGYTNGYDSPGEVVEVKGIADGGEKSEELVRQIMNLVTTRGNVFAVYTIGQAIKQTPDGKLKVTAQQRVQAMVERYLDPADDTVRFSPVYFRNLSP